MEALRLQRFSRSQTAVRTHPRRYVRIRCELRKRVLGQPRIQGQPEASGAVRQNQREKQGCTAIPDVAWSAKLGEIGGTLRT